MKNHEWKMILGSKDDERRILRDNIHVNQPRAPTPVEASPCERNVTDFIDDSTVRSRSSEEEHFDYKQDEEFHNRFRLAQEAILEGMYPQLIPQGSSGSYFVRDVHNTYLAVFKPKDEEPFAPLNPKWPKFFQRILCFCCFGRACLIQNNGFLSETGASFVDGMLKLSVVPYTRVVKLASPTFFYTRYCGRYDVRPKEGSFQLFVHDYESAQKVFGRWEYDKSLLSEEEDKKFTSLFQKMCVLDYIIRNTDRHMDNLLIRHVPGEVLELAAIDNGLAFPVKHPEAVSRFRTFPFRWAELKWAKKAWDEPLREHLLTVITPAFVHHLCKVLRVLFRHNNATSKILVNNQLRVMRGQIWNLRLALESGVSPTAMSQMVPLMVFRRYRKGAPTTDDWKTWFRPKPAENPQGCCGS